MIQFFPPDKHPDRIQYTNNTQNCHTDKRKCKHCNKYNTADGFYYCRCGCGYQKAAVYKQAGAKMYEFTFHTAPEIKIHMFISK